MEDKLITLSVETLSRAHVLQNLLEMGGVKSFLKGPTLGDPGVVAVRILSKDYAKALDIIEVFKEKEGDDQEPLPEETFIFKKILLPIGFTEYSLRAFDFAASIAKYSGAEIHMMHVYPEPVAEAVPFTTDGMEVVASMEKFSAQQQEDMKKKVMKLCVDFRKRLKELNINNVSIDYSVHQGIIDDQIRKKDEAYKPDLIILGTKGHGKKNNDFIGRVTEQIIETTEVPVLTIPEYAREKNMHNANVLFATNFDETDTASLKILSGLLDPFDITIYCLHIGDDDIRHVVEAKMNKLKKVLVENNKAENVVFDIIPSDNTLEAMQDYIMKKEINLIALTMHKYDIITGLFRPNMTKKILFHTNIPVFIFHA
jgi:nucleotide-binding universal stress UspA family protein